MKVERSAGNFDLAQLLPGVTDFQEFAHHDAALKFWLPEVVAVSVMDMSKRNGCSVAESLRQFFFQHCYGVYAYQLLLDFDSDLFKDCTPVFSNKQQAEGDRPGKRRIDTYWLPDLGKNVAPIKVWLPSRVKTDLQRLADHVGLSLSHYAREIVISRLMGHAKLPVREGMLETVNLSVARDWEQDREVPLLQAELNEYTESLDGENRTEAVD